MLLTNFIFYLFLSATTYASDKPQTNLPTAKTDQVDEELIVHRRTLATQLGLTDQDVDFGKPRNFKQTELNELQLEAEAPVPTTPKKK